MKSLRGVSSEEIVNLVKGYIDNNIYNYAILIDGEWGSGKTYFLKNILKPKIEQYQNNKKARKVIYISLYGMASTEDISNSLYCSIMANTVLSENNKLFKKVNKLFRRVTQHRVFSITTKFASDIIKNQGYDLSNYENTLLECINFEDYIFFFDDLERCQFNISEVLGYINNFVEHESAKVVLVANEKEINKFHQVGNLELKYLVASKSMDLSKEEDRQEIKKNIQEIFDEYNEYKRIKEKLIGITIRYFPDFQEICKHLISENINDKRLSKLLMGNLVSDIEFATKKNHLNLRTYQFYIEKIKSIYEVINEDEQLLVNIFSYTYKICVLYKAGVYNYHWSDKAFYNYISLNNNKSLNEYVLGFKFIDDYIINGYLNINHMRASLEKYLEDEREKINNPNDPMNVYSRWWEMSEADIKKGADEILKLLEEDYYSFSKYPNILVFYIHLEIVGFGTDLLNKVITTMTQKINENVYNELDFNDVFITDSRIRERYKVIIEPLEKCLSLKSLQMREERINKYLDNSDWSQCLYSEVSNKTISLEQRSFLDILDINKVFYLIEKATSKEISMFRYTLGKIYDFSNIDEYYKKDVPNIKLLLTKLKELDMSRLDLIQRENIRWLIDLLEEVLQKLSK